MTDMDTKWATPKCIPGSRSRTFRRRRFGATVSALTVSALGLLGGHPRSLTGTIVTTHAA